MPGNAGAPVEVLNLGDSASIYEAFRNAPRQTVMNDEGELITYAVLGMSTKSPAIMSIVDQLAEALFNEFIRHD